MVPALILFGFVLFLIFLFTYILILPLWLFLHCTKSDSLPSTRKAIWIVGMLITWPLGSFLYGFLHLSKKLWKGVSAGALVFTLALVIGMFVFVPKFLSQEQNQIDSTIERIQVIAMPGTPPGAREILKSTLTSLKQEVGELGFFRMERIQVGLELHELLTLHMKDEEISPSEYQSWLEKYRMRQLLDREALEQFISETR